MSDRTVISARVPTEYLADLREMSEKTGQSLTDLIVDALADFTGRERPTSWGDRLALLEGEVKELREKLSA